MAANQRRYTDEERASLVVMLQAEGYPDKLGALKRVAEYSGVRENVLRRWFKGTSNPPPATSVTHKKIDLADLFEDAARQFLEHGLSVLDDVNGKDAMTAAAIAIDKMSLLRSQPTQRIAMEHSGQLTIDERRRHIAGLLSQDDSLRRFIGASPADD